MHDIAQICLNGHIVNDAARTFEYLNKEFCETCGAPTIMECRHCKKEIQGAFDPEGKWGTEHLTIAPNYCTGCGEPYPWTAQKILATAEFVNELEEFSNKDKEIFLSSFEEIVKESPMASAGAVKIKKLMRKLKKESLLSLRELLINIGIRSVLIALNIH
jgi:hypothetical protein